MNRFTALTIVIATTLIITACGAPAAPTANPVDVQNTAVAAAFTVVAQTQAAVPTNTPLPPTEAPTQTPLATNTPLPLPTLDTTLVPTLGATLAPTTAPTSGSGGGDPCNKVLGSPLGKDTVIRIWNNTTVPVTVSLYLNPTEAHLECGYRSYNLAKNGDVIITDLVYGCYSLLAWSDDPKGKFSASGGGCINNPDKWTFEITPSLIKFLG
jgi:hypothetical protein